MPKVGWVDTEQLPDKWLDAPEEPELSELLEEAFEVCSAYAPALASGAPVPRSWSKAQLFQAQHLYARSRSGNGETMGPDGYSTSTYVLVLEARNLLRPKRSPLKGLR
jgi:hypothetical protein